MISVDLLRVRRAIAHAALLGLPMREKSRSADYGIWERQRRLRPLLHAPYGLHFSIRKTQ